MSEKVQILDKTFKFQLSEKKRKSSIKWAALNFCFLSIIYYDIHNSRKFSERDYLYYIEVCSCGILSLSLLTNVLTFVYYSWFTDKIICENEAQRILLSLNNSCTVKTTPKVVKPVNNDSISIRNLSYQTYSERKYSLKSNLLFTSQHS